MVFFDVTRQFTRDILEAYKAKRDEELHATAESEYDCTLSRSQAKRLKLLSIETCNVITQLLNGSTASR